MCDIWQDLFNCTCGIQSESFLNCCSLLLEINEDVSVFVSNILSSCVALYSERTQAIHNISLRTSLLQEVIWFKVYSLLLKVWSIVVGRFPKSWGGTEMEGQTLLHISVSKLLFAQANDPRPYMGFGSHSGLRLNKKQLHFLVRAGCESGKLSMSNFIF